MPPSLSFQASKHLARSVDHWKPRSKSIWEFCRQLLCPKFFTTSWNGGHLTLFPGLEKDLLKGSSFDAIILTIHFVWQSCILRRCDSGSLRGSSRRSWNPLAAHGAEGPILDITHAGQYGQSFKQWAFFQRAGKQWTIPWANFHCSFGVFKTFASFPICQSIFPAQTKGFCCTASKSMWNSDDIHSISMWQGVYYKLQMGKKEK